MLVFTKPLSGLIVQLLTNKTFKDNNLEMTTSKAKQLIIATTMHRIAIVENHAIL